MAFTMKTIFLAVLALITLIHLASLFFKHGVVQAFTKVCLVPLILGVYISGVDSIFFPVVLALIFGWLGDVFLLKIENIRFFKLGLASFLVGHICYIPSMLHFTGAPHVLALIISLCVAAALGLLIHRIIRPSREMNIPTLAYETAILLMNVCALQLFLFQGAPFGTLVIAGGVFFMLSDTMLALFTFHTRPRYGDFLVMFTYIAAQLCIILGLSGFSSGFLD